MSVPNNKAVELWCLGSCLIPDRHAGNIYWTGCVFVAAGLQSSKRTRPQLRPGNEPKTVGLTAMLTTAKQRSRRLPERLQSIVGENAGHTRHPDLDDSVAGKHPADRRRAAAQQGAIAAQQPVSEHPGRGEASDSMKALLKSPSALLESSAWSQFTSRTKASRRKRGGHTGHK